MTEREKKLADALRELIGMATWMYDDCRDATPSETHAADGTEYDSCRALREACDEAESVLTEIATETWNGAAP